MKSYWMSRCSWGSISLVKRECKLYASLSLLFLIWQKEEGYVFCPKIIEIDAWVYELKECNATFISANGAHPAKHLLSCHFHERQLAVGSVWGATKSCAFGNLKIQSLPFGRCTSCLSMGLRVVVGDIALQHLASFKSREFWVANEVRNRLFANYGKPASLCETLSVLERFDIISGKEISWYCALPWADCYM